MVIVVHGGAGKRLGAEEKETISGLRSALGRGWACLEQGAAAVEAVTQAVAALEDWPVFDAGVGACLNAAGRVEWAIRR